MGLKVLIVCSGTQGILSPFIKEQIDYLTKLGIEFSLFQIRKRGFLGYLLHLKPLRRIIKKIKPDLIHAHYGLTALLANLQRKVPVISTFHGSDIWVFRKNRLLSQIAHILSKHSIIVNKRMSGNLLLKKKISVIPCGVDLDVFYPVEKLTAIGMMNLPEDKINLLFSSKFDYYEKNYPLARKTMEILGAGYNLIELDGYSRSQVNFLLNACDVALMTSISEGSPQFIKEAMACNCPIVSTDVGDVSEVIGNTEGCYISTFDPGDLIEKVKLAVKYRKENGYTRGRERIIELGLDSATVTAKIIEVYKKALKIDE